MFHPHASMWDCNTIIFKIVVIIISISLLMMIIIIIFIIVNMIRIILAIRLVSWSFLVVMKGGRRNSLHWCTLHLAPALLGQQQHFHRRHRSSWLGKGANNENGNLRWYLPLGVNPPSPLNGTNFQTFFYLTFSSFAIESYIYEMDFTLQKYHF